MSTRIRSFLAALYESFSAHPLVGPRPSLAEIANLTMLEAIPPAKLRNTAESAAVALPTVNQAWQDERLNEADPERIGLIVGGPNTQQCELFLNQFE